MVTATREGTKGVTKRGRKKASVISTATDITESQTDGVTGDPVRRAAENTARGPSLPLKVEPKIEHGYENLKTMLNTEDMIKNGRELAAAMQDQEVIAAEFAKLKTAFKDKLAGFNVVVKECLKRIRDGYEFKDIPVTIVVDYDKELVTYKRDDTGEVYRTRALDATERQFRLNLIADANKAKPDVADSSGEED